jgi:hypothetical protein
MVLARRILTLTFFLVASTSFSKWEKITERWITAFDMLNSQVGLAAALDGAPLLMRIENGKEFGIVNTSGAINAVTIVDKDIAYMSVSGDGVYKSSGNWEFWKRINADPNAKLVGVTSSRVFAQSGKKLLYSANEAAFEMALGIDTVHEIKSVVGFGDRLIAASQSSIYYSTNGGAGWTKKFSFDLGGTLYLDTVGGVVIAGGNPVVISRDSGKSWATLSTPIFPVTSGRVYGSRDCSGAFYIVTELPNLFEFLRSTDHGVSLQILGPGPGYSAGLKKIVVTDRGSTVFWLDNEYHLIFAKNGIDGTISDSIASKLSIRADTGIVASACQGGKVVPFTVHIGFSECTGVRIDNMTIEGNGFATNFTPKTLGAGEISIPGTYKASKVGYDTGRIKVIFRSLTTNQTEVRTGTVVGRGVSGPAELSLSTDNISYGILDTGGQMIKSLTVLNMGCDALRIDSAMSSLPNVFNISGYTFPMYVLGGSRTYFNITFSPSQKQKYLESLEIYTSEGIRYVTLTGEGTFDPGTATVEGVDNAEPIDILSTIAHFHEGLRIRSTMSESTRGSVYTIAGNLIANVILEAKSDTVVELSEFSSGMYYLLLNNGQPPISFYVVR